MQVGNLPPALRVSQEKRWEGVAEGGGQMSWPLKMPHHVGLCPEPILCRALGHRGGQDPGSVVLPSHPDPDPDPSRLGVGGSIGTESFLLFAPAAGSPQVWEAVGGDRPDPLRDQQWCPGDSWAAPPSI